MPKLGYRRTHCKRGHPLTDDNVFVRSQDGRRRCKKCKAAFIARYQKEYPQSWRDRCKVFSATRRNNLHDAYVKLLLVSQGFPPTQVTPELIDAKRAQVKLRRLVRKKMNHQSLPR